MVVSSTEHAPLESKIEVSDVKRASMSDSDWSVTRVGLEMSWVRLLLPVTDRRCSTWDEVQISFALLSADVV